ncbi:TetR/AcrR family transcriptional regulator C-terminal domain-containing protein [Vallitalea pronyensis]|uniref:TetR/AcrR family transcriptional regulator C-terminal domain-containing protein n=1 Tax=Vallitalea pronyensis TaxID=1348613 RepID=A0A8J8MMN9_9FIRM|nr:TetR/AcrR family transcriptional regulator [Vallitalea pronyensis]QUI24262.1 TetR/AcrR family transcriptional regulator C-terminal domain-containing protein [Vallitalea pronyensis]
MIHSHMTKHAMAVALKKEMEKKSFHKISIKNITKSCGLTRQAFYYHFQDIYELLGWIYSHEVVETMHTYQSHENWKDVYLNVFKYIEENKLFCMNTLHSIGRDHLEKFLFVNTAAYLSHIVDDISEGTQVDPSKKELIVDFYTPAFIALVAKWMESGMKEKPEEIVENLAVLVEGTIEKALRQYEANEKGLFHPNNFAG